MTFNDELPKEWTTYDRVATTISNMKFLLIEMRAVDHQARLRDALGPTNYEQLKEYFECVETNLEKMARLGVGWATVALDHPSDDLDNIEVELAANCLDDMANAMQDGRVNAAWNLAEKCTNGEYVPDE